MLPSPLDPSGRFDSASRPPDHGAPPRPRSFLFDDAAHESAAPLASGRRGVGRRRPSRREKVAAGVLGIALIFAVLALPRIGALRAAPPPSSGTLVVESQPPGWHVWDGEVDHGPTPVSLSLPAGRRTLVLRRHSAVRELHVEIAPGERSIYHLDLPGAPVSGDLHVVTKPAGAIVAIDGIGRGTSPIDVRDLKAGRHAVTILNGDRVITEQVTIEPGRAASLVVPLDQVAAPAVGWVVVRSPIQLQVYEDEALVGSSRNVRLMFMPGRHVLRLTNTDLNVEETKVVQVQPGATTQVAVALPAGSLSVNAAPWAEVWLDGQRIGQTPIANYAAPLGEHEIVLRHPKLGEQRHIAVVRQGTPVRVGVDLRE